MTLGLFAAEQFLFLVLLGGSIGHLLLRMRVVPLRGGYLGVWRPFVRTVLLCLFIPAVIWDADQRGLHDKIAGTHPGAGLASPARMTSDWVIARRASQSLSCPQSGWSASNGRP